MSKLTTYQFQCQYGVSLNNLTMSDLSRNCQTVGTHYIDKINGNAPLSVDTYISRRDNRGTSEYKFLIKGDTLFHEEIKYLLQRTDQEL